MSKASSDPARVSRFIALLLRHNPAAGNLTLDAEGWTPISALLRACNTNGYELSREALRALVAADNKGRYAISDDDQRIRANQGHSVAEVALTHAQAEPPELLYHGTVPAAVAAILRDGLLKMQRHHVHLSPDTETATKVAQRRGKPVIFTVRASAMRQDGMVFWRSENGVWLTEAVPPVYLSEPEYQ